MQNTAAVLCAVRTNNTAVARVQVRKVSVNY